MEVLEIQTENRRNGRLMDQAWLNTDRFVWLNFEVKRLAVPHALIVCLACVQLLQGGSYLPQNKNSSSCPHIEGVLAGGIFIRIQNYPEMNFLPC